MRKIQNRMPRERKNELFIHYSQLHTIYSPMAYTINIVYWTRRKELSSAGRHTHYYPDLLMLFFFLNFFLLKTFLQLKSMELNWTSCNVTTIRNSCKHIQKLWPCNTIMNGFGNKLRGIRFYPSRNGKELNGNVVAVVSFQIRSL